MSKAYRRHGRFKRHLVWAFLCLIVVASLFFFGASVVSRLILGIPVAGGWRDAWVMLGGACFLCALLPTGVLVLRGPGNRSPGKADSEIRSLKLRSARRPAMMSFAAAAGLFILGCTLVIPVLATPDNLTTKKDLPTGIAAMICGGLLAAVSLMRAIRRAAISIDIDGIHLEGPTPQMIRWKMIGEVRVNMPARPIRFDPELDRIDVVLGGIADVQAPPSGWRRLISRLRHVAIVTLKPWEAYDASPTEILEAIDRFRPPEMPIHDPRRIIDEAPR